MAGFRCSGGLVWPLLGPLNFPPLHSSPLAAWLHGGSLIAKKRQEKHAYFLDFTRGPSLQETHPGLGCSQDVSRAGFAVQPVSHGRGNRGARGAWRARPALDGGKCWLPGLSALRPGCRCFTAVGLCGPAQRTSSLAQCSLSPFRNC